MREPDRKLDEVNRARADIERMMIGGGVSKDEVAKNLSVLERFIDACIDYKISQSNQETGMRLGEHQIAILTVLSDGFGGCYLTRDIAKKTPMFGHNMRIHSGSTRSWLVEMEKAGLVKRLDDDKPTVWAATDAGRDAVRSEAA
jgi:hypothetical protein